MKFASFDIETAALDIADDLNRPIYQKRFGIACAAILTDDMNEPEIIQGSPQLTREQSLQLLQRLQELQGAGYTIVTWNGTKFDFQVLAQETELKSECAALAMGHIDAMLFVTFRKGFHLSLQKACTGAGLEGKLKNVLLKDGTTITGMSGGLAPELWAKGEFEAVLAYLKQDVIQLQALIRDIEKTKRIRWTSQSGKPMEVKVESPATVRECFTWPLPDTSWMSDPPRREDFTAWMAI